MDQTEFREIKKEIRLIGIDDGSFDRDVDGNVCLVGAISRGGHWIDGFLIDEVEVDGIDSTETIVNMINRSRHKEQLRIILTSGITFAGFNVLDVKRVYEETGLPVIVVIRDQPDMDSVKKALRNLQDWEDRWDKLNSAGEIIPVQVKNLDGSENTVYIQVTGMESENAKNVVGMTSTRSSIPEPLRIAHLVATAISRGESVGGA